MSLRTRKIYIKYDHASRSWYRYEITVFQNKKTTVKTKYGTRDEAREGK